MVFLKVVLKCFDCEARVNQRATRTHSTASEVIGTRNEASEVFLDDLLFFDFLVNNPGTQSRIEFEKFEFTLNLFLIFSAEICVVRLGRT